MLHRRSVWTAFLVAPAALFVPLGAFGQTPNPAQSAVTNATSTPPRPGREDAQPAPQGQAARPESSSGLREAQQHITRALERFRARDYRGAIHEFELANAAAPSADLWFNIAQSYELLNEYDAAIDYYNRYLRDKVDPPDRAEVERHITDLRRLAEQARAARLRQSAGAGIRFDVATAGASVYLATVPPGGGAPTGERLLGRAPIQGVQRVEPGTYQIRVRAPGTQEWRGQIRVRQGSTVTAYISPLRATQYRTRPGGHALSFVLGGLGLAAFGTGVGMGVYARTLDPYVGDAPNADRLQWATTADVMYGVGAVFALSAVIVYFIEAGSSRTEVVTGGGVVGGSSR